jgi:hypothetical protein
VLGQNISRPQRRLYDQRDKLLADLLADYQQSAPPDTVDDIPGGPGGTAIGRTTPHF